MHTSRQRGFTFIELVMFIVIVGVSVSAITLLFVQNVRYSADPLLRQKSIAVAKAYMDEIVRKKWDALTPDGGGCIDTATFICESLWQVNTVYNPGDRVRATPFNDHIYEVVAVSGSQKSGPAEPTWPIGGTVSDGSVTWQDMGAPTIGADGGELRSQYDDVDDYHNTTDSPPQIPDPIDLVDGKRQMPGYDNNYTVTVTVTQPAWETFAAENVKKIDLQVSNSITGEALDFTLYRVNY